MKNEKILVVPQKVLQNLHQGFIGMQSFDAYENIINVHKQFLLRSEAEVNPEYKQIIPYLIFSHNNAFFLMQRRNDASESRLSNKYSLGIGGHIRQEDIEGKQISSWAWREFHEEVNYQGMLQIRPLGVVNDDATAVGKVHLGLVFLLVGNQATISIKSELKEGRLVFLKDIKNLYHSMETWTQHVYDFLLSNNEIFQTTHVQHSQAL